MTIYQLSYSRLVELSGNTDLYMELSGHNRNYVPLPETFYVTEVSPGDSEVLRYSLTPTGEPILVMYDTDTGFYVTRALFRLVGTRVVVAA